MSGFEIETYANKYVLLPLYRQANSFPLVCIIYAKQAAGYSIILAVQTCEWNQPSYCILSRGE